MSISTQRTYSEPKVTRQTDRTVIEFDITIGDWTGWESLVINRVSGDIEISARGDGPVRIPAQILPLVLAEVDRIVAADGELPLTPPAPVAAISPRDPAVCYICGHTEHEPDELHAFWSNADAQREWEGVPDGPLPSMSAVETLDPREAVTL